MIRRLTSSNFSVSARLARSPRTVPISRARPFPARKYREEVGPFEIGMEFAVDRWAGSLNIRDIEQMLVGATRISRAHRLAHHRMRAVASGDVGCLACLFLAVGSAQTRNDAAAFITVAEEFGAPLDRDAELFERCNQ